MSAKTRPKPLALTRIESNLTYSATEVTAWYLLPEQRWNFLPDGDRKSIYDGAAHRYADLCGGRNMQIRVTTQPYPAAEWARKIHVATPRPVDPAAWREYLLATQNRLEVSVTAEKKVYLGVTLKQRGLRAGKAPGEREAAAVAKEERIVADLVRGDGLEGRPATTAELEWLMHRSVGLALPPTSRLSSVQDTPWEASDLYQLVDNVTLEPHPFGGTTTVSRVEGSQQVRKEVAVLTLGRIGPKYGVDSDVMPWLTLADTLPFPVEISVRVELLTGAQTESRIKKKLMGIRDQQKDYRKVGMDEPIALDEQGDLARQFQDQMARGLPVIANSAYGHVRFAVSGDDIEQVMDNVRLLRDRYAAIQMDLVHVAGTWSGAQQIDLLREFIPGEPVGGKVTAGLLQSAAYTRRVPVRYIAAGMPQVASRLGDSRGPYIGYTIGGNRRAVHLDPNYSQEELRATGLVPIISNLGGGKSMLTGSIVYANVLRGTSCISFDPSGPFAKLTELPELRGVSRAVNLLDGAPGTLNPFAVVAEPKVADFFGDPAGLEKARLIARQQRRLLSLDVLTGLLPAQMASRDSTRPLLMEALRDTAAAPSTDLTVPLKYLKGLADAGDGAAKQLWTVLSETAELPMASLFFTTGGTRDDADLAAAKFLVLTMPGLAKPLPGTPREEWGVEEQLSVAVLQLAAWYTSRLIYSRPMKERKMATFDEGHFLADWSVGRTLFTRLARDNRKWNLSVIYASQSPKDILGMDVADFAGTAFVGRIEDPSAQKEALRMLKIQPGLGHEQVLASLSRPGSGRYGEFVMRDSTGNVDLMKVDLDHIPHVREALDTSVTQVRVDEERAA